MNRPKFAFLAPVIALLAMTAAACTGGERPTASQADPGAVPAQVPGTASGSQEIASMADASTISSPAPVELAAPAQPRPKVITLDPGHGGPEIGAVSAGPGGYLAEKDSNLDMAYRLRTLLEADGYHVVLTRETDARATGESGGSTAFPVTRFDLQRRIDIANEAESDLFVSLHSNGSGSASESGIEVWYDPNHPWGTDNLRLAQLLQRYTVQSLRAYGYRVLDRGVKDDTHWRVRNGRSFPIFVLGPPRTDTRDDVIRRGAKPEDLGFGPGVESVTSRALQMPAALIENLFLTNATDAAVLRDPGARDAIARGMRDAINAYFGHLD
jgi:N-acetylmuramoyl-L-alanine amidase